MKPGYTAKFHVAEGRPLRHKRYAFARALTAPVGACSRAAVAGALCALLAGQPVLAEVTPPKPDKKAAPRTPVTQIPDSSRALHALNRLTFGPRPGDAAAIQAMGLDQWFERQLKPSAIDDSALEARLSEYPAMKLSIVNLEKKYPGPLVLKAVQDGRIPMPSDPAARALMTDQLAFYKMALARNGAAATVQKPVAQPQNMAGQNMAGENMAGEDMAGQDMAGQDMAPQGMAGQDAASPGGNSASMGGPAGVTPAQTRKGRRVPPQQKAGAAGMQAAGTSTAPADKPIPASQISADPMMADASNSDLRGGFPSEELQKMLDQTPDERMKSILALPPNQLIRLRLSMGPAAVARMAAGMTPEQKELLTALPGSVRMIALESMESRVMRDVYSERQLEAVMTDFWLNHFNVYVRKNQNEPYLIPEYERETIRPRALGNFEDLLVATAKSPAMLVYLDNFRSVGPDSPQAGRLRKFQQNNPNAKLLQQASAGLNENYGRELMELHTLGVNGGYTQADVTEVARVFTGWGIDRPYQGGEYKFDERRHQPGNKTVMGRTIAFRAGESGETEGLEVLHILATSPATAHFISQKLAVRFVSDQPPAALVDRMAASFLASKGDIKTVLRTMYKSPEFWSTDAYRAKVKTPEEFVVSAVRASGAQVINPQALVASLDKLGMPLYGMQTPNGYSWLQDGWVSTNALVSRMNFSLILSADRLPGVKVNWTSLLDGSGSSVKTVTFSAGTPQPLQLKEQRLEQVLLGEPASDRTRATVLAQSTDSSVTDQAETQFDLGNGGGRKGYIPRGMRLGAAPGPGSADPQAAVMAGLLLGSPEFQRR